MSFSHNIYRHDPITKFLLPGLANKADEVLYKNLKGATPPPPPGVPNPNDAANAALQATDQLRMRRGLLANIYGGAGGPAPVAGKTALGT